METYENEEVEIPKKTEKVNLEPFYSIVPSSLEIIQFNDVFMEMKLFFQIIFLQDSFQVWIGSIPPRIGSLCVAFPSSFVKDPFPCTTSLLGSSIDIFSQSLAQRLTKKSGKPFYISCDVPSNSPMLQSFVEKRIFEELKQRKEFQKM